MQPRLVLRIERDGQLLGSWTLQDAPLEMTMVDLGTGRVVARFTASADQAVPADAAGKGRPARWEGLDEVPVHAALQRLDGDDFTMPLPEPTDASLRDLPETEERPALPRSPAPEIARPVVPTRRAAAARTPTLVPDAGGRPGQGAGRPAALRAIDESLADEGTGLTGELIPDDDGGPARDVAPSHDELPVPPADDDEGGLTGELRTATTGLPDGARPTIPMEDDAGLTDRVSVSQRQAGGGTDPEYTPRARVSPPPRRPPVPRPAEVWSQKRGEWRSIGHLVPGQRVRTLGGWVRLAPDGRLVVRSGQNLEGSATLDDGRMIEIAKGEEFLALPPGSSVTLEVGDRGIYVRSEPLPTSPGDRAGRC
ncbi:MAG: hypothetical protein D6798_17735 [Deltaproteobacteria bacterium]|nr:MAG: hypothetical protein D6798_17735 [Deltaproteobacteria bacterium]